VVVAVFISLILATGVAEAAAWKVISSPSPGVTGNELISVAVVAANDVWAVGDITVSGGATQTLTEHWNGTQWSVVSSPNPMGNNLLRGVASVSANNIWAVGFEVANGLTLIGHWNGTKWRVVKSPNPGPSLNILNGVAADPGSGQTWAVGVFFNANGVSQTLTEFHP